VKIIIYDIKIHQLELGQSATIEKIELEDMLSKAKQWHLQHNPNLSEETHLTRAKHQQYSLPLLHICQQR
jgi:hypothetical protein